MHSRKMVEIIFVNLLLLPPILAMKALHVNPFGYAGSCRGETEERGVAEEHPQIRKHVDIKGTATQVPGPGESMPIGSVGANPGRERLQPLHHHAGRGPGAKWHQKAMEIDQMAPNRLHFGNNVVVFGILRGDRIRNVATPIATFRILARIRPGFGGPLWVFGVPFATFRTLNPSKVGDLNNKSNPLPETRPYRVGHDIGGWGA